VSSNGAGLPLKSRGGYAVQAAQGLFVLKAGRARGAFFELKLKTCPEVGVILTPLRRDTFSMVLVLPDTGEYEPQALIYNYNLTSTRPKASLDRAGGLPSHSQPRVRAVTVNLATSITGGHWKTATADNTARTSRFTNKQVRHLY
jgi:hypothetical protein